MIIVKLSTDVEHEVRPTNWEQKDEKINAQHL